MRSRKPKNLKGFHPAQAAKLAGLSRYMIDYLCRNKIVVPSACKQRGRGVLREYSFADIVLLRVVSRLLKQGISVMRLRKSLISANKRNLSAKEILSRRYMCTDGENIYFLNSGLLERLDSGQTSFAFVVDLRPVRTELEEKIGRTARTG